MSQGVITSYPKEAVVVVLDVSGSMMLDAFPPDEDTAPELAEGLIRIKCSSLLSSFVVDISGTATVGDVSVLLLAASVDPCMWSRVRACACVCADIS